MSDDEEQRMNKQILIMKIIHIFANYMPVYVYIVHAINFFDCLCAFPIHFKLPFPLNK